jgi:hypothetical protein
MPFPLAPPRSQWVDNNGDPLVGGSLEFLDPATGLQKDTYPTWTDADALTNPNTNPVVLDVQGAATVFLLDGESYDVICLDADDVQLWRIDDVETQAGTDASGVTILDTGGYYVATDVEAAFAELGAATGAGIIGLADGGGHYAATDVEAALAELGATENVTDTRLAGTSGSFTPTHTGFSSAPTGDIRYFIQGELVTLQCDFSTGTSDQTFWTITNWPAALQVTEDVKFPIFGYTDNTAVVSELGSCVLTNASAVATFYSSMGSGTWTGSGTKGLVATGNGPAQITYTIF